MQEIITNAQIKEKLQHVIKLWNITLPPALGPRATTSEVAWPADRIGFVSAISNICDVMEF